MAMGYRQLPYVISWRLHYSGLMAALYRPDFDTLLAHGFRRGVNRRTPMIFPFFARPSPLSRVSFLTGTKLDLFIGALDGYAASGELFTPPPPPARRAFMLKEAVSFITR